MSALAFIAQEVNRSNSCDKNTIMLYYNIRVYIQSIGKVWYGKLAYMHAYNMYKKAYFLYIYNLYFSE